MNTAKELLEKAVAQKASDIFIVTGLPASMRVNHALLRVDDQRLMPRDTEQLLREIYALAERPMDQLLQTGDDDFSFPIPGVSRFRASAYKQRGSLSIVIRLIATSLPDPSTIGIPESIISLGRFSKGLVLVTGPAGSGKSTTLACIIDHINRTQEKHIITLEDPLEFLHRHDRSIVSQREINTDTENYETALRAALRQSPDVILLGEMRDYETMQAAVTAAETGHLVFSTLHTTGSAKAVDRIIDVFPPNQQRQIADQLSLVLQAVVSQQLVPTIQGPLTPAFELMTATPDIRSMIRGKKIPQIDGRIYSSPATSTDMFSMDASLLKLFNDGRITAGTAMEYATVPRLLAPKLQ
ncbi:MAG: PilT/PilU family type 4a pilus ATPase [Lachnospiraceae bacterium]|jgi:twitching motility protein PilT|nr:PilT/PilU family type 4a pilus ATPase [Lachnospiraceae bacterium]